MSIMAKKARNVLVVHSGRRDGYEVAMALSAEYKVTLLTDFYYEQKRILSKLLKAMLGSKVYLRNKDGLDCQVVSSFPLILLDFLGKYNPRNSLIFRVKNKFFEMKARAILNKQKYDYLLFYSNHGASGIFESNLAGTKKILFQMHPHPDFVLANYNQYILSRADLGDKIRQEEEEFSEDESYRKAMIKEAHLSDLVICATNFTKKSLSYAGVDQEKIIVIPYGVELKNWPDYNQENNVNEKKDIINLAFVGQFVVRKGIYELLDAVKINSSIHLNIYTQDASRAVSIIRKVMGVDSTRVTLKTIKDNNALWEDVRENDFLILPSLVEGFGMVILEAMGCGLPVIASKNTAGPDIITDGKDGYLLKGISAKDINKAIDVLMLKKASWRAMRFAALETAKQYQLSKFRKKIIGVFSDI